MFETFSGYCRTERIFPNGRLRIHYWVDFLIEKELEVIRLISSRGGAMRKALMIVMQEVEEGVFSGKKREFVEG